MSNNFDLWFKKEFETEREKRFEEIGLTGQERLTAKEAIIISAVLKVLREDNCSMATPKEIEQALFSVFMGNLV